MFQSNMSPKLLNVEKLEKKFASLTRSRESIQGLSMWIIRHKDCYKEIVNQWLDALSRDFNALTMFYVANDVIQNCGRKKAPEYREAFASVLERAVSLEKVKEIKTEVTRMLTLWHERAIYDDEFFKKLDDKLNATVEESESEKEEELPEAEVIANFKLENVINSLKKLKTLEEELHEKETFLEDIVEPGMGNIDNLIVKMDSQKELRKFDKFQKLVEDCIILTDKVIAAKKAALLNLKYSSIFYSAQMEDAKKVAHAYRIYGKKVKMLEKSLFEKMSTLPEQTPPSHENSNFSPCAELSSSQESLSMSMLSPEPDRSDCQENDLRVSVCPERVENESRGNTSDKKDKSITEEKSPTANDTSVLESEKSLQDEEKTKKTVCSSDDAKDTSSEVIESLPASKAVEDSVSKKTSETEFQALPDIESIDFLLEKAYDDQVKGSKLSFKRKIDNLLKSKQAKACKLACDEDSVNNKTSSDTKISSELVPSENKISCQSVSSDYQVQNSSKSVSNECNSAEKKCEISELPISKDDCNFSTSTNDSDKLSSSPNAISVASKSTRVAEKISETSNVSNLQNTSNTEKMSNCNPSENFKCDHPMEVIPGGEVSNNNESKNVSSSNSFAFQTLPDIPTELLKNILDKHRINMNLSSNADIPLLNISSLSSISKHPDQPYSTKNDEIKVTNANHSLITKIPERSLQPINNAVKGTSQEFLDTDNTFNSNIKDPVSSSHSTSDSGNVKMNNEIKSTLFLENLQNVLEHFTTKETSFKDIKCSKTLSALTSMPLENSLRVFNCIMQNCNVVDSIENEPFSSSNFNSNIVSDISKKFLNNEKFCSSETNTNLVSKGIPMVQESPSVSCDKKEDEFDKFSFNSKNDNLEIIDMELDSEDDDS